MSEEKFLKNVAKYSHEIRTGALNFNYRTGQCGPVQATQLRSWGAACPPGYCPPNQLPEALGRYFAGDRTGCREIPYVKKIAVTAGIAAIDSTVEEVSKVTMCPTRLIIQTDFFPSPSVSLVSFKIGNQNQLVGGPVLVSAFDRKAYQDVPIVPDCIRAGQPFSFTIRVGVALEPATVSTYIMLIGPAIG